MDRRRRATPFRGAGEVVGGLGRHGYGNWNDIADHIGTNKTPEEVQSHYEKVYLNEPDFLPNKPCISQRDGKGTLIQKGPGSPQKRHYRHNPRKVEPVVQHVSTPELK